jgi:hypothetical protein
MDPVTSSALLPTMSRQLAKPVYFKQTLTKSRHLAGDFADIETAFTGLLSSEEAAIVTSIWVTRQKEFGGSYEFS